MIRTLLIVTSALMFFGGCTRMRFIVDAVPAENALKQAVVRTDPGAGKSETIALIEVKGMMTDSRGVLPFSGSENPVARLDKSLTKAAADGNVKAVILRIDSPGGTVTASDIMYHRVRSFRETSGKPVVVQMGSVAASGGYYLACAGDEIIAHPTTITGSIGVIMQLFNFSGGMQKIGLRADAITSGPNKIMGSPFEPMPEEHRELFQGIVDEFYVGFVDVVSSNRLELSADDITAVTDGRVVTGRRALEVGMVDGLGGLDESFAAAKRHAGLQRARMIKYHRPVEYVDSPYASTPTPATASQVNMVQLNLDGPWSQQPGFYYLWDPMAW